jgi:hypothetical protein
MGHGDLDRSHRAIFRVDGRRSSNLFNETAHQAKPVSLAFGLDLKPLAISILVESEYGFPT